MFMSPELLAKARSLQKLTHAFTDAVKTCDDSVEVTTIAAAFGTTLGVFARASGDPNQFMNVAVGIAGAILRGELMANKEPDHDG